MPAFVNPYTQQLMNQPLDSNFPSQPVSSPNTTHLLAPQTGSVLQPLLDTVIGNKQRQAEQQQLDFQRQQVINKNLQQKAKRQALVNFVDRAAANPDSPAGRFITERFNDPQAAHDLAASGAFDPSTFLADFSKFSAGFSARSKELKTLKGVFARFKNSPLPQIIGADNVIAHLGDLAQSETGIAQARQTLTQLQNLQNELLQKQRTEHAVFTQDGKTFFRFNKRGGITPVKNANTKTNKVINLNDFSTGIGTNDLVLPPNEAEAVRAVLSPEVLQTNRSNTLFINLARKELTKQAQANGVTLTADNTQQIIDDITKRAGEADKPTTIENLVSQSLASQTSDVVDANKQFTRPPEGTVLTENNEVIPLTDKRAMPAIITASQQLTKQQLGEQPSPLLHPIDAKRWDEAFVKNKRRLIKLRNTPAGRKELSNIIFAGQKAFAQNPPTTLLEDFKNATEKALNILTSGSGVPPTN